MFTLWGAILVDVGTACVVCLNGMRCLRWNIRTGSIWHWSTKKPPQLCTSSVPEIPGPEWPTVYTQQETNQPTESCCRSETQPHILAQSEKSSICCHSKPLSDVMQKPQEQLPLISPGGSGGSSTCCSSKKCCAEKPALETPKEAMTEDSTAKKTCCSEDACQRTLSTTKKSCK